MNIKTYMQGVTPATLKASIDSQMLPKPTRPAHAANARPWRRVVTSSFSSKLPTGMVIVTSKHLTGTRVVTSKLLTGTHSFTPKTSQVRTVRDVGEYILRKCGDMSAMKLQKLVYYAQAWSLVWDDAPLFKERIEAWANGPVSPVLYQEHRGTFRIKAGTVGGKHPVLSPIQAETVDAVLKFYGDKSPQWLSDLTHFEPPWREARQGLGPGDRGNVEISHAAMVEYYGSLQ